MTARTYQRRQIRRLVSAFDRGARASLVISATGTGKTLVAAMAAQTYHELAGYPSIHLAPTIETVDQALRQYRKLYKPEQIGIMHGLDNSINPDNAIIVSTPHTMREPVRYAHLMQTFPQGVGAIIADEAHHFMAPQTSRLLEALQGTGPAAIAWGFTATAERADEKHMLDQFDDLSASYDILDAMHDAYLTDLRPYTIKTGISLENVHIRRDYDQKELERAVNVGQRNRVAVDTYREYGEGQQAIAFCAGVEHAIALEAEFNRAGIPTAALHDDLSNKQRRTIIDAYRQGTIRVLTGYNIPLEGLDVDSRVALWLRPTKLEHIYVQASGRTLRPAPAIAGQLGELHDVEDRRELLERTKGYAIILELRDEDPRSSRRPTVGIASILGLPATLQLTGEPIRLTSQRMDLIASRMPDRARHADSDTSIKILADLAKIHFGAPETPLLPDALRRSRVEDHIPWMPHGPRRYAAPLLLNRGNRIREDSLVLSAYGDIWAVEHARHGVRTPLVASKTFQRAITQAARYYRDNHTTSQTLEQIRIDRTPEDMLRLGSPIVITIDGQTRNIRDAITTELNINPNRYHDRARLWDRAALSQPRKLTNQEIAFTSIIKVDIRQQELIRTEADTARRVAVEHGEIPSRQPERANGRDR